jgi:Zn-dependent protease with chaperone function
MISAVLLALALALMALGGRLRRVRSLQRSPRLAIVTWQVLSATALLSLALAGLTQLVPPSALGGDLAAIVRACVYTLQAAYAAPTRLPGVALGAGAAVLLTGWAAANVVRELVVRARQREHARAALLPIATHDAALGASVIDAATAGAYCVAGRRPTVVLTTGALQALQGDELRAVVAHERAHLRQAHHLPVAVAHGLARAFPRVPLFAAAAQQIDALVEILADEAAAGETDDVAVAGALVALAGMRAPAAALGAASSVGADRVLRLLNRRPSPPRYAQALLGAALVALATAPIVLAAYPALAASAADVCVMPPVIG